jgi:hypothetical protein
MMPGERLRTVLGFAIIGPAAGGSLQASARAVGESLGCVLHLRRERGFEWFATELLGMAVELLPWHGDGDETVVLLRGYRPSATSEDSVVLDISEAIVDIVSAAGQGDWRAPTPADLDERRGGA